jgi:hypothetical protein
VQGGATTRSAGRSISGVVQSANHAVFTAAAGRGDRLGDDRALAGRPRAGDGRARARRRDRAPAHLERLALARDHGRPLQCARGQRTCAPAPDTSDLLLGVPALEAAFLIPTAAALRRVARRARA